MKLISSWSGGKDSCLALFKAIHKGYEISILLNFISDEYKRCCFHGVSNELMNIQAEAIQIPIVQKSVPADMEGYETQFKLAVNELKKREIQGMVFGDIYLEEHKSWVDRVCNDIEITPIEPLWNLPAEKVVKEFIDIGFKAIVVSAKADLFEEDFLGREINYDLISEIKKKNICCCGENGEFHTFVYDGPIFKKKIIINETEKILKEGFWKHWFLDIKKYKIEQK
ncbi:MAG: diphthine--ammonia ligase [Candidatus Atribacteria bacterium]|nr:diphthine--ammonia ligase [Candidatus Atribacteria bacterium]